MNGEDLYLLWVEVQNREGFEVDDFDSLDPIEQLAWNETAEQVEAKV